VFNSERPRFVIVKPRYLKGMVVNGDSWPDHFIEDANVFTKNPDK
nr:RecName: Full=Unknown protein 9 [Pseudotsuga menziesii]